MTDKERIKELEAVIKGYEKSQVWYSNALERLSGIRYNYSILLDKFTNNPFEEGFKIAAIQQAQYEGFVKVADKTNEFFSFGDKGETNGK